MTSHNSNELVKCGMDTMILSKYETLFLFSRFDLNLGPSYFTIIDSDAYQL